MQTRRKYVLGAQAQGSSKGSSTVQWGPWGRLAPPLVFAHAAAFQPVGSYLRFRDFFADVEGAARGVLSVPNCPLPGVSRGVSRGVCLCVICFVLCMVAIRAFPVGSIPESADLSRGVGFGNRPYAALCSRGVLRTFLCQFSRPPICRPWGPFLCWGAWGVSCGGGAPWGPVCVSACVSVCLSVFLSVFLSVSVCVCLSACLSVSVCLSVFLSVCLSFCLSVYLSFCLSVCLSACLSVLSVCLSVRLVCLSVCSSV